MRILAIETSCDETGISIIDVDTSLPEDEREFKILSNELASQAELHSEYGGVYPTLAKREHLKALPFLFGQAISKISNQEFQFTEPDFKIPENTFQIDAVAVTHGPGLEPALWTGINFARNLAEKWNIPLIPVNHMEGHIFSALLHFNQKDSKQFTISNIKYPAIALLISGGHTDLVFIKEPFNYEYLGGTVDDAVGEAFDKVARMLNLGYPGGPIISKLAQEARTNNISKWIGKPLPRPMINSNDYNFSFSGLKTAVLYKLKTIEKELGNTKWPSDLQMEISREFEDAVADVLTAKVTQALNSTNAKTLIIGGGVAANTYVHNKIKNSIDNDITTYIPTAKLTGDNGLMIAIAGYYRLLQQDTGGYTNENISAHGKLKL